MNAQDDYTPLQSLLLVQALATSNSSTAVFDDISAQLRQSAFFTSDKAHDDVSFTPESLKSLYLSLAKEEARREINGSRNTPRRKSPVPKGAKQDAQSQYGRRAAELVPHLYEEYRAQVIREIKEEERRYHSLTGELKALKEGHDAGPSQEDVATRPGNDRIVSPRESAHEAEEVGRGSLQGSGKSRRSAAPIDSIVDHDDRQDQSRPSSSSAQASRGGRSYARHSPETSARLSEHDPHDASSPGIASRVPVLPSQSSTNPAMLQPSAESVSRATPPPNGQSSGANGSDGPPNTYPISSRSGRSLPHSQDAYVTSDPYGASQYNEVWRGQQPVQQKIGQAAPHPSNTHHALYSHPYASGSGQFQGPGHQRGGVMLPPFQVSPQSQSENTAYARHQPGKHIPEPLRLHQHQSTPYRRTAASGPYTPLSGPNGSHLLRSGVSQSPGSSTGWRLLPGESTLERPSPREVSPLSEPEDAASPAETKSAASGRRKRQGKGPELPHLSGTLRRGAKASSVRTVSPSARSQSASSQFDESFRHPSALRYKTEIPDTPGAPSVSGDETLTPTNARQTRRGNTRRNRALSTTETNPSVDEEGPPKSPVIAAHQPAATTVVAMRNFNRVAAPILNTISSHKHASLFAEPVTNRQADNYEDYVKHRQDLKSIRAAIKNGERAVNAATAAEASPGGGATSSSVILPITEALIPPKSIVNAAQLEAEVYRMFANAVMFNTGNSGFVLEAREMFQDTEREIQNWRSMEGDQSSFSTAGDDDGGPSSKRRRM